MKFMTDFIFFININIFVKTGFHLGLGYFRNTYTVVGVYRGQAYRGHFAIVRKNYLGVYRGHFENDRLPDFFISYEMTFTACIFENFSIFAYFILHSK